EERFEWKDLGWGVYRLSLHFGFMEDPNIPSMLERIGAEPVPFNPMTTSYFLGRETLIPTKQPGMAIWREHLFAWMTRNASSASIFFSLPANQVIELGAHVELSSGGAAGASPAGLPPEPGGRGARRSTVLRVRPPHHHP